MSLLYIIRHSERLDEQDKTAWLKKVDEYKKSNACKNINHRKDDPCLTRKGEEMAQSLSTFMANKDNISDLPCIYVSRLQRAVQTAYPLAKELNLPLCVSSGLSSVALAVRNRLKNKEKFEYFSVQELAQMCDGVDLIDGDDPEHPLHVPPTGWKIAVNTIARRSIDNKPNIIVAHRELNRKIIEYKGLKTPPCCVSLVQATANTEGKFNYSLIDHTTKDGTPLPKPDDDA